MGIGVVECVAEWSTVRRGRRPQSRGRGEAVERVVGWYRRRPAVRHGRDERLEFGPQRLLAVQRQARHAALAHAR